MEKWKRQALHYIAFEIDPQHTLILTTQKACGIYYTYVPQHTIPFRSLYCIARISFTANHTPVVTICALYDILLLRITSSSSLALALAPALPSSNLLPRFYPSIHPSLASDPSPAIYLLANDDGVCGLPFSMFHIHGVWTRTTGIGLLVFLSTYFIHSFLFFHSLFANQTIYLTLFYLFWYVSLFGLVLVLVLV